MLKRKIEQNLVEWKNTINHKPLIIKGCRQCGKTFNGECTLVEVKATSGNIKALEQYLNILKNIM